MKASMFLSILLLACCISAYADEPSETIQHSCDATNKQFRLHYQVFWNESAPSGAEYTSDAGNDVYACMIDGIPIKVDLVLYSPSAQGMCGGVPGGKINSLKLGNMEVLSNMPINSCYSSWLDYVLVSVQKDTIEITFCGSHYQRDKGEQAGCFVERFKKSQLPIQLYSGSNFPFGNYKPNIAVKQDAPTARPLPSR